MAFFASTFDWPTNTIDFASVGPGARDGTAEVVARADRWILKSPGSFSGGTYQPSGRTLTTTIDGVPTLIRGAVHVIDEDLGMRVDEIRVGSIDESPTYTSVTAQFEHLSSLCSYRHEDGAARSAREPLALPALGDAATMSVFLPSATDTVVITAVTPAPIEAFEEHLTALQDLFTFGADMPIGRLRLDATETSGDVVQIVGRERFAPFQRNARKPVEHILRLSGEWTQAAIERWWEARTEWRPITQIISGLRYQPGYVEADVILTAVAIEALATKTLLDERPRLSATDALPIVEALDALEGMNFDQRSLISGLKSELSRTTLRSTVDQLVSRLGENALGGTRLSVDEWLKYFIKTRNGIAHGGPGLGGTRDLWIEGDLLRAVRDANWVMLVLALLQHLGAPDSAIDRAAERLGVRYGTRHGDSEIFA